MNTPDDNQLSLFSTPEPPLKSSFCDWEIDREGYENSIEISGYESTENEASQLQINDNTNTKCSDTWISLAESEASALQPNNSEEYRQLSLWKSTPMLKQSSNTTSQEYPFTQTSETTTQNQENLKSLAVVFPAQAQVAQEAERDYNTQHPHSGEKDLDVLSRLNPASVLSNSLKELLDEDFELFLADSLWQDTLGKLAMCRQQSLGRVIKGSGCLSFPTLTSNVSTTSRPAGQTALLRSQSSKTTIWALALREKWFKDNGLIKNGYQLGTKAIALTMGFPSSWFEGLTEQYSKNQTTPSQGASLRLASRPPRGDTNAKRSAPVRGRVHSDSLRERAAPQAESEQGIWQDEQLHQHKQPSPSAESYTSTQLLGGEGELLEHEGKRSSTCSEVLLGGEDNSPLSTESSSSVSKEISIPCLVKQPKQPEVKGVIRKDEGDRFLVETDGEEISVSKLFVYPDFSKSVGQIEKSPRKNITPSTNNPRKTRRKKGQGNGTIYYRTVTKNGKQYQEAYYHYRSNGKKRTKYIPKKLLDRVKEAEFLKLPTSEILILLGGDKKNPRKSSSTLIDKVEQKINDSCVEQVLKDTASHMLETDEENPRKIIPPSKKRRKQGEGSGWIECKPIKRSGKEYKQYWYHYEEWEGGDRLTKKSRYIPKRLIQQIERMNDEKAAVREILEVFQSKRKK